MTSDEPRKMGIGKRLALAIGMPLALLLVFLALAPMLLGDAAAQYVEDRFAADFEGRLEIGALELAWTGPQRVDDVRLFGPADGPAGEPVATLTAELPSLFDLLSGGGQRLGRVRATLTADLVADDSGETNLQRALARRAETEPESVPKTEDGAEGEAADPGSGLTDLELDLELLIPSMRWSDAHTRALGAPFTLEDVKLIGTLAPDQPMVLNLAGRVRAETEGVLELRAALTDPATRAVSFELDCNLVGFPTGLIDGLAGLEGELQALLGPTLELHGGGRGTLGGGEFELTLESEAATVHLTTRLDDGRLALASELSLDLSRERLDGWIAPSLPVDLRVERADDGPFSAELELAVAEFGAWLASDRSELPAATVKVRELQLGDWRVASGGVERVWTDLRVEAELSPERVVALKLASGGADPLELTTALRLGAEPPDLRATELSLPDFPTALIDRLAQLDGQLERLLGTRLDLGVSLPESSGLPTQGELRLHSSQLDLQLAASYAEGVLELRTGSDPEWPEAPALVYRAPERLLREFAPELEQVQLLGDLVLELERAELPLGAWLTGEAEPAELLPLTRLDLALRAGALEFTHTLADGSAFPITLEALALDLQLADGRASTDLSAGLQDSDGVLSIEVQAADLGGLLAEPPVLPPLVATATAEQLPTLAVDLLAEQDGMLVEMLGSEVSVIADGHWPARGQPFNLELRSPKATLDFEGTLEDGVIVAGEDQQLTASAPLGPLFSSRVVGRLVPLLIGITKSPNAGPVRMRVEHFNLPLDGDLAKLDCDVLLELGDVSYQLLPGFQGALEKGTGGDSQRRTSEIAPLQITVRSGVVTYDETPLKIDGAEILVGGTYDLLSGTIKMTTLVPLKNLGRGVGRELERARDYLDPAVAVPLEIGGTIARPTINLGKSFVDTVLPGAVRGAISGGLSDLFGRDKEQQAKDKRKKAEKKARKKARREAEEAAKQAGEDPR